MRNRRTGGPNITKHIMKSIKRNIAKEVKSGGKKTKDHRRSQEDLVNMQYRQTMISALRMIIPYVKRRTQFDRKKDKYGARLAAVHSLHFLRSKWQRGTPRRSQRSDVNLRFTSA